MQLPAYTGVAGDKLQMITPGGIGDTSAGQEGAPKKGDLVAVILHHGQIDVVGHRPGGIIAIGGEDGPDVSRGVYDKGALSGFLLRGENVEADAKGPAEKPGKPGGKGIVFRYDADKMGRKAVGIQQNAIGLCQGAAFFSQGIPAEFGFNLSGKCHISWPSLWRHWHNKAS